MPDWVLVVVGAANAAVFTVVGWLEGRRSTRRRPVCVCGHNLAVHDWSDGECQADVLRKLYATNGQPCGWRWGDCNCRGYIGKAPTGLMRLRNGELIPADGKS